jgi:N-glycosylase/DNA lyase
VAEVEVLLRWYDEKRSIISSRLSEFAALREASDERWLSELAFCILVADGNARTGVKVQKDLVSSGMLYTGNYGGILRIVRPVRYNTSKAKYILHDRDALTFEGKLLLRSKLLKEWELSDGNARKVRDRIAGDKVHFLGLGMKEASHFLRNIGYGADLAILDVHILNLMMEYGVLPKRFCDGACIKRPSSMSAYHEVEDVFVSWAEDLDIPPSHLDLALWSLRTGEVLK